ncbi:MAG: endonuclease/exonuclease/phosphatase family protein [Myxococcota bacterium]
MDLPGPRAALAILALAACAGPPPPARAPVAAPGPTLDVLTYNVNFELLDARTIDAIAEADADVVFLQETTPAWEAAVRARLAGTYPHITFRDHPPDGGMAVLARHAFTTTAWVPSPVGSFPAWCLAVDTPLGPLRALHVHLHPPLDDGGLLTGYFTTGDDRRAELEAFLGCFDGPPDLAVGDFNEGEGDAVDLLVAAGLVDAASTFPPPARTWAYGTRFGELEGRPDHVFVGGGLVPTAVEVREVGGSDHRPLRVTLARAAP